MLHNALDRTVKERLILRNSTEDCIIPKLVKQEMKILHLEDMGTYLQAANKRDVLPMFYLELVSGLRKGELVALLWSDLDSESCTISVSKQAAVRNGEITISRPKTETSVRRVSIPHEAVELLMQEHEKHPDNRYMFPSPKSGGMYYPDSIVNLHEKILQDAGLEHIRFHDLRHTVATMISNEPDANIYHVMQLLGHTQIKTAQKYIDNQAQERSKKNKELMGRLSANGGLCG